MRLFAGLAVGVLALINIGCAADGVMLQPAVQGEWSNFHSDKHQVSADARPANEQSSSEKAETQNQK
jgi:anti-sigma factor RsiW